MALRSVGIPNKNSSVILPKVQLTALFTTEARSPSRGMALECKVEFGKVLCFIHTCFPLFLENNLEAGLLVVNKK